MFVISGIDKMCLTSIIRQAFFLLRLKTKWHINTKWMAIYALLSTTPIRSLIVKNRKNTGTPARANNLPNDLAVFIGRFQPFHPGHLHVLRSALDTASSLAILVGSANEPRSYFNPFWFEERKRMIETSLAPELRSRVLILPLHDHMYNNAAWVMETQDVVNEAKDHFGLNGKAKVALVGHSKDHTSYYLKMFPQWGAMEVGNFRSLSATPIRELFFNTRTYSNFCLSVGDDLEQPVLDFLYEFMKQDCYSDLITEYEHVRKLQQPYLGLPYPPIFQTVDGCIVQSGHVLMIKRRSLPGRGLWALPGAFIKPEETITNAVMRVIKDKTKIDVPERVLRMSVVTNRRFDDPNRSSRGRTITDAFLIRLQDNVELPKVTKAEDVQWWPIADVQRNMCFEDHFAIISNLTAVL
jgi:bifunctional NMN adenylyltransferase/nudix hydrolase